MNTLITFPIRLGILCLYLCSFLPHKVLVSLGNALGGLSYYLFKSRRQVAFVNLQHCYPEKSSAWHQAMTKSHLKAFTTGLMEQSICWWWSDKRLSKLIEIHGIEHLHSAKAHNKGVILLCGHFTSIEMGCRMLGTIEKAAMMYRRHDTAYFDDFIAKKRAYYVSTLIDKESPLSMVRLLKQGECVWFGPDQNFVGRGSILASFFKQVAPTTTATAKLVAMTDCKVLPITQRRKANGGYELLISPALENFTGQDELADTNRINLEIEKMARANVEDYYWVHRRFKNLPDEYPDIYRS